MGTSIDAPAPRDYGQETRDTLQAQVDLAPAKYAAESRFAPLYQDLQLRLLAEAAPKLMQVYGQDIVPVLSQIEADATRRQRQADITAVQDLGPESLAALRAANPQQAELLDAMQSDAMAGLRAGSGLTPEQASRVQQSSRQAWSSRGLGYSPAAGLDEVMRTHSAGSAEQDRRRNYAGQVFNAQRSAYGDPFQMVLGRPSATFSAAQGYGAQAQGFNPGALFNPESQYAGDIANQNYQGTLSARTASAANQTALIGAGMQAAGSAASSM